MEEENLVKRENGVVNTSNNSNNKNGIIAALVIIIIALIGVVIYFAFIKKDDKPVDNNGSNNQNNEIVDNSKYEDNTEYKAMNFDDFIKKMRADSTIKDVKYEFHDVVQNYEYEQLDNYYDDILVKLTQDRKINLAYNDGKNITISNVSNVKDYVSVLMDNQMYIITDNGDVYKFFPRDDEHEDKAIKIINVKNADKFVFVSYSYNDALYISTGLGIVDKNNNYIELVDITGL